MSLITFLGMIGSYHELHSCFHCYKMKFNIPCSCSYETLPSCVETPGLSSFVGVALCLGKMGVVSGVKKSSDVIKGVSKK